MFITFAGAIFMKKILLLGAGRSSGSLINYLLTKASGYDFELVVGDRDLASARQKIGDKPRGRAIVFDIENPTQRSQEIAAADMVISLLPPALHLLAAEECLKHGKNLITASYVSPEIRALHGDALAKGLLFLNECGLDPGIDHMSAMEIIHRLQDQGASITAFHSYTGGLVAPESNDNLWGYKFTWNPRNVILAGQGTARYIQQGKYHYIPYPRLFSESVRIHVEELGNFDGYANRDSLAYRQHYGIDDIPTLIRGTLRQEGFCSAWQVFVQLGLTDDSFQIEKPDQLTYRELIAAFIPPSVLGSDLEEKMARYCQIDPQGPAMARIRETGILDDKKIGISSGSPATILQHLLEQKWVLKPDDKDMIVMQHRFAYRLQGREHELISSLVVKGEDTVETAMAKTVGLPLGIAALLMLEGKIPQKGVQIPVHREIYKPVLQELAAMGISFKESIHPSA